MADLSQALGGALSPEALADLNDSVSRSNSNKGVESVTTPGACAPGLGTSKLTTDGTDAVTLADGTVAGQRKYIVMVVGTTTPVATLTPATYADGTTCTLTGAGSSVILEWDGTTWHTMGGSGITIA